MVPMLTDEGALSCVGVWVFTGDCNAESQTSVSTQEKLSNYERVLEVDLGDVIQFFKHDSSEFLEFYSLVGKPLRVDESMEGCDILLGKRNYQIKKRSGLA